MPWNPSVSVCGGCAVVFLSCETESRIPGRGTLSRITEWSYEVVRRGWGVGGGGVGGGEGKREDWPTQS